MNQALPLACSQSNTVAYLLILLSLAVGTATFVLIKKGNINKASILVSVTLLLPLILWIIDGFTAMAQSAHDPDYEFGSGCFTEGIFSQLARLNYGIWTILSIISIAVVSGFVYRRLTKKSRSN